MKRLIKVVLLVILILFCTPPLLNAYAQPGNALDAGACPAIQNTPFFTIVYGTALMDSSSVPVGTVIKAYSPRSNLVGCFVVTTSGDYGAMYVYGEDTSVSPTIPGMRIGETVSFSINDAVATPTPALTFQSDKDLHPVNLSGAGINANFTATPQAGIAPLDVAFSDTSTGSFSSWSWTFGDGQTSTSQNPTHTYVTPGTYAVSLSVSGSLGSDTETKTGYITVHTAVSAGFSVDQTTGVAPLAVIFTNQSSGDYSNLSWSFGDGGTSTAANPSHTYTSGGIYTVSLTASGPGGTDVETKTGYVSVYNPVTTDFTYTPASGVAPLTVDFTNNSNGDYTSLAWSFGDGVTSSSTNPSHTYTSNGTFTVTLTAAGPGGTDSEIKSDIITVYAPVAASFSASPTSGVAPFSVAFSNSSSGDYTSSLWDFGDGSTSTESNPVHEYSIGGIYTVNLTVSGPGGSDSHTRTDYITVQEPVTANFSADITSGVAPLEVHFTNNSTGDFTSFSWDFGDGATSTQVNPTHTYVAGGTFTVGLNATGPGGTDQEIKSAYITVYSAVAADFTFTPSSGTAPLLVQFTNTSSGDYSELTWDFGDNSPVSHETNPQHTFTQGGNYHVILTASGSGGEGMRNQIVVVTDAMQADFSGDKTTGVAPLEVLFTDLSVGEYQTLSWDFGDGGTSTEVNPTHTYIALGSYTVTLTVSGDQGADSEIKTGYITVYAEVEASFSASPVEGRAPLIVQFTNLSSGHTSQTWTFGDGSTSTADSPSHIYSTPGTYTVTLVVDGLGGTDTYEGQIHVQAFNLYLPLMIR